MNESAIGSITERMFIGNLFSLLEKPERLSTIEWSAKYRFLTSEVSATPGTYDPMVTPYMLRVMDAFDNLDEKVVVARKSAQIGWSETFNNYLGRIIHTDPQNILLAFPREDTGKAYSKEKLNPFFSGTEVLRQKIGDPNKSPWAFFRFKGGFLKLLTAGSPTAMKSTTAPIVCVEEPDDLSQDIKMQGDALMILTQRQKTFTERCLIYGGTPTDAGFSKVDQAYQASNKMQYLVPCHSCGDFHRLSFKQLLLEGYSDRKYDERYGANDPSTAYYLCPHCNTEWSFEQKVLNVKAAVDFHEKGWEARVESDIVGFTFNELLSPFAASDFATLAGIRAEAEVALIKGKTGKMKSFVNNCRGLAYEDTLDGVDKETIKSAMRVYKEGFVPVGGIILTAGVDVQHNRFAIVIRAWGRNGQSWLVRWVEIFGMVKDRTDPVWKALTQLILSGAEYETPVNGNKVTLPISGVSIDSGDGVTASLVYSWVLQMNKLMNNVFACKGASESGTIEKEIFNIPADPDAATSKSRRKKLSETMGVNIFSVGTQKGKDEVLRKLSLVEGTTDRSYYYQSVRKDYVSQLISNARGGRGNKYQLKVGRNDEVLDCEVLALHCTIALHLNLWTEANWRTAEIPLLGGSYQPRTVADESNVTGGLDL